MGIRLLQTYLERTVKVETVSIKELVDKFRIDRGDTIDEVVIVVDGSSCLPYIFDEDWLLGGQIKRFRQQLEIFVKLFTSLGVRLVFYFDGPLIARKRPVWNERVAAGVEFLEVLFDILNRGENPLDTLDKGKCPRWLTDISLFIFVSLGCEVRTSERECDEEIAEYARSHRNCLAILAQDTDFVISQGAEYYLSISNLNTEEMTTLSYDRWKLAQHLKIPAAQLPLFASLCGNDIIKMEDLKDFHLRIYSQRRRNYPPKSFFRSVVFEGVAEYISKKLRKNEIHDLASIASFVFRDGAGRREQLQDSIESYGPCGLFTSSEAQALTDGESTKFCTDNNWRSILTKAKDLIASGSANLYYILCGYPINEASALEDYGKEDLPLEAFLFLPLRERIYGILLQERPDGPGVVEEWLMYGREIPREPTFIIPVLPPQELHPGLLALWGDGTDVADTRWKLFAHTVSRNLSFERLKSMAEGGCPHLVITTVILQYLREAIPREAADESPQYLSDWELEALAIQAALMKSTTDPSYLVVPTPYDVRAIRLATLFIRAFLYMLDLLVSCGSPIPITEAMPWLYFDGKLFHTTYVRLKNGESVESLCINPDGNSVINDFLKVRNIVLAAYDEHNLC